MLNEKFNHYSFILERTARRVKQFAQASFVNEGIDLTVDQWSVIKALSECGNQTQKELAERCGKDQPTLTRMLDLLDKKQYIARVAHPTDRRCLFVKLTTLGQQRVKTLAPIVTEFRMKAWENLTDEDFEHFSRILKTIYENLDIEKS